LWNWTEQERKITVQRIKDGIEASSKRSGRATGKLDKMSDGLKADIQLFIKDRSIKQIDLMQKHNISRNTLKKYIEIVKSGNR
jgi:DNA invertase Pin-like site-specific DNA recombinase